MYKIRVLHNVDITTLIIHTKQEFAVGDITNIYNDNLDNTIVYSLKKIQSVTGKKSKWTINNNYARTQIFSIQTAGVRL